MRKDIWLNFNKWELGALLRNLLSGYDNLPTLKEQMKTLTLCYKIRTRLNSLRQ